MGFTDRIVNSVEILTKPKNMSYDDYLDIVNSDDNAWAVKIADLKHNLNIGRIPNPTDADYKRLEKYKKALAFLEEEEE